MHNFSRSQFSSSEIRKTVLIMSINSMLSSYQLNPLPPPPPPLGLTPGPLIFFVQITAQKTAFQSKIPAPGSRKTSKIPTQGHNLSGSNAKISMTKEHNSIRAVSFQIFHNCPSDNFLLSWESSILKSLFSS